MKKKKTQNHPNTKFLRIFQMVDTLSKNGRFHRILTKTFEKETIITNVNIFAISLSLLTTLKLLW